MSDLQAALDYADAIADCFMDAGEASMQRGDLDETVRYLRVAANVLSGQNRTLASPRLEADLRLVAGFIPKPTGPREVMPPGRDGKEVCLHVLSEALPAGGLTAMAMRWIANDRNGRIHSVALLSQNSPIPGALLRTVGDTGGSVFTADRGDSFLDKAAWLRNLANSSARCVVLHVAATDVIGAVAFGTPGGPPVLLVNHTAHLFWAGVSCVDVVVNCRGSALEESWTLTHRGATKCATIPIPLLEPAPVAAGLPADPQLYRDAKAAAGLPPDSIVLLTVGAYFKYLPVEGLDFLETLENILNEAPRAYLLVVGFDADGRWEAASRRLAGRIRVLGTVSQDRLAVIHGIADVYLEGFPFGTTTALLEAGLRGIPSVLAPIQCPPPYGSDGVALDAVLERPRTLEEYKAMVIRLCTSPAERARCGGALRSSIVREHAGPGWRRYLEDALGTLPREHSTHSPTTPSRTPKESHEYWSRLVSTWSVRYEEVLEHAIQDALSLGLRPRITRAMVGICEDHRPLRKHRTIPIPLLAFLCNFLLPVLPDAGARNVFRLVSFFYRGSLLTRIKRRAMRLFGGGDTRRSWYGDYRKVRE